MPVFSGKIIRIDLNDPQHASALVQLLDQYARDPMGGAAPLSPDVYENLIERLRKVDQFRGLLASADGKFVGLANCFLGFSTFKAQPLINIHDLAVAPEARGQGVGGALLQAVDQLAKEEACAYVTLEVRADNRARQLYLRHGFVAGDPGTDAMSFFKKSIDL
ncbi:GNAT family N-acetyltransferase [Blastopirellula marina]|uniref:GNAT family N-acetyltransferase n=1 Tax=Blastopirellula marina TaxID=124 RepID=A0A2S8F1T9_9BACT|nr:MULTISPECIES: GNAT family N-acetyltransferase [Pirellulaceae]PQO26109.1 GNAT family N-acetyltransferase [Blastopirellula marina]RCS44467.1 GNAT family N-acetyltransferase [Bremerella cremea]